MCTVGSLCAYLVWAACWDHDPFSLVLLKVPGLYACVSFQLDQMGVSEHEHLHMEHARPKGLCNKRYR